MLPTIFEDIPAILDYTTSSINAPFTPSTLQSYPSSEECLNNNCSGPSAPHPCKMVVTTHDKHALVPINNSGPTRLLKIPDDEFPSLPLFDFPMAPPTTTSSDNATPFSCSPPTALSYTTTAQSTPKLPRSERNQSLAHLNRKHKNFGARCA